MGGWAIGRLGGWAVGRLGDWAIGRNEIVVILSAAKDLLSPEPVSGLSRSFVAALLRMTGIFDG